MGTNTTIGKKINKLRTDQKLTLKNLSEATELSIGFLSQLERGMTAVAIDTLEKIAIALGVDLSYFFAKTALTEQDKDNYVMRDYERICASADNSMIQYYLSGNLDNFGLLPRLVELLPTTDDVELTDDRLAPHRGEEFIYVLEGILTIIYGDEEHILYPGDTAHFTSDNIHTWVNRTSRSVKVVVVNFPNPFNEID